MNALDLIKTWPALNSLAPEAVLASPAWKDAVSFEDAPALLLRGESLDDELFVSLSFDGEPHILGLGDSSHAADLHLLWARRRDLPENLLLALVEKECGALFQLLENLSRSEVKLCGLADRATSAARTAFHLTKGANQLLSFSLDLPSSLVAEFGRIENLDPSHASIRALARPIRAHYAALALAEAEISQLRPGDFLMLEGASPRWITDDPADASLHLVSSVAESATFAQFADGALPEIPPLEAADLALTCQGKALFKATLAKVGSAFAVKLA